MKWWLLIFFLLQFVAFGQNITDPNGRKQGDWTHHFPGDYSTIVRSKGIYINDKKEGTWNFYHLNGAVSKTVEFLHGIPFGDYAFHDANGKFLFSGNYQQEAPKGTFEFFESGELKTYVSMDSSIYFNENGWYDSLKFRRGTNFYTVTYNKMPPNIPLDTIIIDGLSRNWVNYVDEDGKRQGLWVFFGKDRPEIGYPQNGIIEEGRYLNNRKEGIWKKYYEDGVTVKLIGTYKNNRPGGFYQKIGAYGRPIEQSCFEKNNYSCDYYRWYDNGAINEIRRNDSIYVYALKGCLKAIHVLDAETLDYTLIKYSETECNVPVDTTSYPSNSGIITGDWKLDGTTHFRYKPGPTETYRTEEWLQLYPEYSDASLRSCMIASKVMKSCIDGNGRVIFHGKYNNEGISGKMYFYDEDDILLRIEVWSNGEFVGEGKI